ncbi:MAG: Smr/MutS family protein [Flavobacteriaceae bacterium]|nr:Smr/MutS family protein [Flavobacteriaceae bacterium]
MNNIDFKIGDKVSVIDDTIIGEIIEIIHTLITIKDENGFQYKYQYKELVKIFNFKESFIVNYKSFLKEEKSFETVKKSIKKQSVLEVDLHIHQITESVKNWSNYEMLSKQLDYARQKLDFAIKNNIRNIVFIHGIGQGVLKRELYQLLKKYKVEINDANYQKYGKGATEVYIYKN